MKQCVMIVAVAAMLTIMLGQPSPALIAAPLDLALNKKEAGVICVGRSIAVDVVSPEDNPLYNITFRVDRVDKGDVPVGSTITIQSTLVDVASIKMPRTKFFPHQLLSGYDLVLLRKDGDVYRFAFSALSTMPVRETAYSPYKQSSDARANLRWEIINSLQDTSVPVITAALRQVKLLTPSDIKTYVKPLVNNPDAAIKAQALAYVLVAGDYSLVLPAYDFVKQIVESNKPETGPVAELQIALKQSPLQPDQVPVVAKGLQSKSSKVRQLSSFMLRESHSKAALPALKAALNDPDVRVRYNAVMGLGETLGDNTHAPAYRIFLQKEQEYISYWKSKQLN